MIQFRRLYQVSTLGDKERLGAVLKLYQDSFPYSPEYAAQIGKISIRPRIGFMCCAARRATMPSEECSEDFVT